MQHYLCNKFFRCGLQDVKDEKGKSLAYNTVRGYFGDIKNALAEKFPEHDGWLQKRKWEAEITGVYNDREAESGIKKTQHHKRTTEADHHHISIRHANAAESGTVQFKTNQQQQQ